MNPKTDRHPSCSLVHKAHSKTKVFGFFGSLLPAVSFCLLSICQRQELWRRCCRACLSIHCARQTAQTGLLSPYLCMTRTGICPAIDTTESALAMIESVRSTLFAPELTSRPLKSIMFSRWEKNSQLISSAENRLRFQQKVLRLDDTQGIIHLTANIVESVCLSPIFVPEATPRLRNIKYDPDLDKCTWML